MTNTLNKDMNKNLSFKELPKVHTTYANVVKSLIPSRDKLVNQDELPKATYEVQSLVIDQANLAEYRKICGFIKDGRVPATYFAVLSQTLQMNMMAKPNFPFAMLGLIHIYNKVVQYRTIFDSEIVHLSVRLDNLREHDRGQQFDFVTDVYIDDMLVWQGVSTYLSRQKNSSDKTPKSTSPKPQPTTKLIKADDGFEHIIEAQEDIGRRYAFVSGDFNLIHLHPLSARAFGYPKAIAHGMWSKAKVLGLFKDLSEKFSCEVYFKTPIFLPSSVELIINPSNDSHGQIKGFNFGAYTKDKPHLVGEICYL